MRKFLTENRVLAFVQIALAFGAGSIVIAVIDSLSSLPWLYLAAIFFLVTAATAAGTYRLVAPAAALDSQGKPPAVERVTSKPARPSVFEELTDALRVGDEIRRTIQWERMGRSLRLNTWRLNVNSLLYSRAPEYRAEMDAIARIGDDLEMYEEIKKLLHRVMKDPNYRRNDSGCD